MKIERKYLHGLLSDALSQGVLGYGYVDVAGRGPNGEVWCINRFGWYDYRDYINLDISPENALSRKFLNIINQFIKDNNIILTESNSSSDGLIEYNSYVSINDTKYVISDEQQRKYQELIQNTNSIKAAKYLSEIFSLPLSVTYEFTKKNRYLKN